MCVALVHKNQLLSVCLLHPVSRKKCFLSVLHLFKKTVIFPSQTFGVFVLVLSCSFSIPALSVPFRFSSHLNLCCGPLVPLYFFLFSNTAYGENHSIHLKIPTHSILYIKVHKKSSKCLEAGKCKTLFFILHLIIIYCLFKFHLMGESIFLLTNVSGMLIPQWFYFN